MSAPLELLPVRAHASSASPAPPTDRASHVQLRVEMPCVLLVRVAPEEEPALGLDDLPVRVLRCKYPIPGCQRALVMRPLLVIVGSAVREWSRPMLVEACQDVGAAMLQLGPLIASDALADWMRKAMAKVVEKRAAACG